MFFCVKRVWLTTDIKGACLCGWNISCREQRQNLKMEKEYFMQLEHMQVVFFQGKFLRHDKWRSSDAMRDVTNSVHFISPTFKEAEFDTSL